jgi:endoglucanase
MTRLTNKTYRSQPQQRWGIDSPRVSALLRTVPPAGGTGIQLENSLIPVANPAVLPNHMKGINLSGAEYGPGPNGVFGTAYIYPTQSEIDYYKTKNFSIIRLPFDIARVQPVLDASLRQTELAHITAIVEYARGIGMYVILDPHSYGRMWSPEANSYQLIGTSAYVTNANFANFWLRLSTVYKNYPNVLYGIMNEPNVQNQTQWKASAVAAINAIRTVTSTQIILIPGTFYTTAATWTNNGNSAVWTGYVDPVGGPFFFEMHQYLDTNYSGTSSECVIGYGSSVLTAATNWLAANGFKGFLAEFDWYNDFGVAGTVSPECISEGTLLLTAMQNNPDQWAGWTWWGSGIWAWNNGVNLDPGANGIPGDQPQMATLVPFLSNSSSAGVSQANALSIARVGSVSIDGAANVSAAHLTNGTSAVDATSYTTASIAPTANNLVLVVVNSRTATGTPNQPVVSGAGITFDFVQRVDASGGVKSLFLYRGLSASPGSGALTISFSGQTQIACLWSVSEFAGVDTSGANGSGALVQNVIFIDTGTDTGAAITLASYGSANNVGFGAVARQAQAGTTAGAGFTELSETLQAENGYNLETEWGAAGDNTVDWSWVSTGEEKYGIAVEIKAGTSGNINDSVAAVPAFSTAVARALSVSTGTIVNDSVAGAPAVSTMVARIPSIVIFGEGDDLVADIVFTPNPGVDRRAEIQTAIDTLETLYSTTAPGSHGGGTIGFKRGEYLFSNTLFLRNGVSLTGTGRMATVLTAMAGFPAANPVINIQSTLSAFSFGNTIQHLEINGREAVNVGLYTQEANEGCMIRDVRIRGCNTKCIFFEDVNASEAPAVVVIDNCELWINLAAATMIASIHFRSLNGNNTIRNTSCVPIGGVNPALDDTTAAILLDATDCECDTIHFEHHPNGVLAINSTMLTAIAISGGNTVANSVGVKFLSSSSGIVVNSRNVASGNISVRANGIDYLNRVNFLAVGPGSYNDNLV